MSHVESRRSGKSFVAVITDPAHPAKRWTKSFPTRQAAEDFVADQEHDRRHGNFISRPSARRPLGERFELWLDSAVNLRDSTFARDEHYGRRYVLPVFGGLAVEDITHELIQGWVRDMMAAGYAAGTIHKAHQVLSKTMASALKAREVRHNPCKDTVLPTIEREEQMFLTPDQLRALADCIDPRYRSWVVFAGFTGLRAGEAFGLQAGRVQPYKGTVEVVDNLVVVGSAHKVHNPKTRAGRRVVPMPGFVTEMMAELVERKKPTDLVWTSPEGRPIRLGNFRKRYFLKAAVDAGLGEFSRCPGESCTRCKRELDGSPRKRRTVPKHYDGVRIHDLRHTAISYWIHNGANRLEVARRAGHSSVTTVEDIYGHLFPLDDDPTLNKLDSFGRDAFGVGPQRPRRLRSIG